ncbi:hypothetical protein PsorP6_004559 [Peronosclerospora sorghi]|uniref:Uncharacterized protein n=1 Tax=Peronosclerospora sorghi TaxID=230839 RepID=A0ACC0VR67_9STRA|nr:hypothetical protein PsorP6_004559 [Peronosclerospora sorghi]
MSFNEFETAVKADKIDEVVVLRPEEELNSSSTMDESVLVQAKQALNAPSGLKILADPEDPYHSLLKEFGDVISDNPPMGLPPDRGVRSDIKLTWFLEPNTASLGNGLSPRSNATSSTHSSMGKKRQG